MGYISAHYLATMRTTKLPPSSMKLFSLQSCQDSRRGPPCFSQPAFSAYRLLPPFCNSAPRICSCSCIHQTCWHQVPSSPSVARSLSPSPYLHTICSFVADQIPFDEPQKKNIKIWARWSTALCGYPLLKLEIRDSSQISITAAIFSQYNYFRQTIWRLASVQFHF